MIELFIFYLINILLGGECTYIEGVPPAGNCDGPISRTIKIRFVIQFFLIKLHKRKYCSDKWKLFYWKSFLLQGWK
jgi:hypothetical protein